MRTIGLLTLKDLMRGMAHPAGIAINLSIPLVLAAMMAMVFRGGGDAAAPMMHIIVVDEDQGFLATVVKGASQSAELAEHMTVSQAATREEGLVALKDEDATAMLVFPAGFGDSLLKGERSTLHLVKNPAHRIMPIVAEQGAGVLALYLSAARRGLGDEATQILNLTDGVGWGDAVGLAATIAVLHARFEASSDLLFPPLITIEEVGDQDAQESASGFDPIGWMYPGMIVMGLLFASTTQMRDLLEEGRTGTLRRLLASPAGPGTILIAKILSVGTVVGIAHVFFLVVGRLVFGISWGSIGATVVVSLVVILSVTGFGAMIFAVARTSRQGDALGGILIMLMSLLGGAFVPVEILPGWLQGVAKGTLNYWAHGALRSLATGGGLAEAAPAVAGLAAVGGAFIAVGAVVLKRRHVGGVA